MPLDNKGLPGRGSPQRGGFTGVFVKFWQVCVYFTIFSTYVADNHFQTSYAADYIGFALLLTAYILVRP